MFRAFHAASIACCGLGAQSKRDQVPGRWETDISPAEYASRYYLAVPSELDVLCSRLRNFAAARGWGGGHSARNLALALAAEVGELGAELQWIDDARVGRHLQDPAARARIADEAADVLIYLVQFADVCGIDLLAEAYAKIERNESRFPPRTIADGPATTCLISQPGKLAQSMLQFDAPDI
jgi:NTP pyrophosphatase (non-canonical NTP hydrolase)